MAKAVMTAPREDAWQVALKQFQIAADMLAGLVRQAPVPDRGAKTAGR